MRILHICSDYPNQAIYTHLFGQLSQKGIEQTVFVPVRDHSLIGKNQIQGAKGLDFRYAHILRPIHRFLFGVKIRVVFNHIKSSLDVTKFDLIHAHFLLSDGEVARRLSQEYDIPFISAVRNTDLNTFFTYKPHLRFTAAKIIRRADQIVFLTPSYKQKAIEKFIPGISDKEIDSKSVIIPNGIPDFWFESRSEKSNSVKNDILKLIFVGEFSRNKNLRSILEVCKELLQFKKLELTLVGGGGDDESYVTELINSSGYEFCNYVGKVTDMQKLRGLYAESDIFVMPSFAESFGLVYIEALSQGLPIIYTKNEGVDGFFTDNKVGLAVNPHKKDELKNAILQMSENLSDYKINVHQVASRFNWNEVTDQYLRLYTAVLSTQNSS